MEKNKENWDNMDDYFFLDYNNGHEITYTFFKLPKELADFDWKDFINKIPAYRHTGCTSTHFQKALQNHGILFTSGATIKRERFNDYMSVPFNKTHYKLLEHHNVGNY